MNTAKEIEQFRTLLSNKRWRIFSGVIYHIKDKNGKKVPFTPNKAQERFYNEKHSKNIILKARQLGFSTLIDIIELDNALFGSYSNYGIIAQDIDTSKLIFRDKVKFAFDNIPDWLKQHFKVKTDRSGELMFESNQCVISVDTSFRGGTLQSLHISEFGKICNKYPEKAREIMTGALNTVSPDSEVFVESTAEGNSGYFYDMSKKAMEFMEMGRPLTSMDYKFFFFPWFEDSTYQLEGDDTITQETQDYFRKLEQNEYILKHFPDIVFTDIMKRWYQKKGEEQKDDMQREYPSFPEEAFNLAIQGAYYEKEMGLIRRQNRICKVPYDARLDVCTAWDLGGAGGGDDTAIWFYQRLGKEIRFIDYWEGNGYSMIDIISTIVKAKPYRYSDHNFPHDIQVTEYAYGNTRLSTAREHLENCNTVDRMGVSNGINSVRDILAIAWFDEERCSKGISALSTYRREFDEKNGVFRDKPKHTPASNGADSMRYASIAILKTGFNPKQASSLFIRDDGMDNIIKNNNNTISSLQTNYDFF